MPRQRLAVLLATWFYIGYSPIAPGTAASIVAWGIAWFVVHRWGMPPWALAIAASAITPVAIWSAGAASAAFGSEDPPQIVIDEVVGQWIALLPASQGSPAEWVAAIVLFRAFDIAKPLGIRRTEGIRGGAGIVADDLAAGACAMIGVPSIRNSGIRIERISPLAAIPGGCLEVVGSGMAGSAYEQPVVSFGAAHGRLIFSSPERLVVRVPGDAMESELSVHREGRDSLAAPFGLGRFLACDLHPVANPAVDRDGNILTTQRGARGKKTPMGLLVRSDGTLLVSSRHNGTIYVATSDGQMEVFAEGMGIATGLAMDASENIYVGDRTGTIFKISPGPKIFVFATLEPSVAAYHLAAGPDGDLFVTAPTTSSFDSVYRIDSTGNVEIWRRGFGRPQGIAFDAAGRLHLCASYRGQRGIFRLAGRTVIEHVVSGQGIVGLAFDPFGAMVVATGDSVYRVPRLD